MDSLDFPRKLIDARKPPQVVSSRVRQPGVSTISLQLEEDQVFVPEQQDDQDFSNVRIGERVFIAPRERVVTRVRQGDRVNQGDTVFKVPTVNQRFIPSVVEEDGFRPYSFSYQTADDEEQTYHSRQEESDSRGEVTGTYSYVDPFGSLVTVNYRAGAGGYTEKREITRGFLEIRPRTSTRVTSSTRRTVQPIEAFSSVGNAEPSVFFPSSTLSRTSRKQFSTTAKEAASTKTANKRPQRPKFRTPSLQRWMTIPDSDAPSSRFPVRGNFGNIEDA